MVNNPLTLVDPSGFFFKSLWKGITSAVSAIASVYKMVGGVMMDYAKFYKHIADVTAKWTKENWKTLVIVAVGITVSVLTAGAGAGIIGVMISGAASGFATGVTGTMLNGGNIGDALRAGARGAAIGALTAAATYGVGGALGHETTLANVAPKMILHGAIQGEATKLQGGKFENGFYAGAISTATAPIKANINDATGRIVASSIVGGTTSELTGGKFADGAVTGAFVQLYNEEGNDLFSKTKEDMQEGWTKTREGIMNTVDKAGNAGVATAFLATGFALAGAPLAATAALIIVIPPRPFYSACALKATLSVR